ncbi:porphobilinogen deaminase [Azorhizobium oxalatiphilum]|uniref:Porphobilinogen deaminase n=1 Tax=Azorhizobium oxalatiphilum TaxID=980631 RepID=A0A917C256_9HYPH|nr:hydroxymethylbilane synthase [Azorhizobium oxalatiphilum]GGF64367.1 porphobilinogen deaminase [Azorhizobium oxalatiphilum]
MPETIPSSTPRLAIGTRGSPLALWQAHAVRDALAAAHGRPVESITIEIIKTSGDAIQDRSLSLAGGKGLFTKEIEEALLSGRIDLAVHSAKDMATALPDGLFLSGYLPRADVRDALILREGSGLDDLAPGARVGTASLRREAQLRRIRPDLDVQLLRGNVQTRLDKVKGGTFDATLLALAGLTRLGLAHEASAILDTTHFLPAVGQGAVAIESREGDAATNAAIAAIACRNTGIALAAERALLTALDGSCRTPIGGLATVEGDRVRLRGLILAPDGTDAAEADETAPISDAARLGAEMGARLRDTAPARTLGL